MPFFQHDDIQIHYESIGSGEPLVMCHGLTGDRNAPKAIFADLTGLRLIVADARAHGMTEPLGPESKLCFAQLAVDLRALLEYLKIDQAVIGGISMGAGIAARTAIDYPDLVRGLILIRPAWLDLKFPENLSLLPLVAQLLKEHGLEEWQSAYDQHPLVQEFKKLDPLLVDTIRRQFDAPLALERSARLVCLPGDSPIRDWHEVESLDIPALVIGSEADPAHPVRYAETWAAHLPRASLRHAATKSQNFQQHAGDVRFHVREFLESLASIRAKSPNAIT
jgi:pimeloyl-ACP methyl ester carboxylesterase